MGADRFTLRTWFMILMGAGITILFIMSSTALWKHNFWETILFLSVAASLTFIFYRGRLALLAAMGCAWIVVNAGLTAVFHPTVVGISLTVASVIGLVFFCRLVGRQHPSLLPDDWQKVFDRK